MTFDHLFHHLKAGVAHGCAVAHGSPSQAPTTTTPPFRVEGGGGGGEKHELLGFNRLHTFAPVPDYPSRCEMFIMAP